MSLVLNNYSCLSKKSSRADGLTFVVLPRLSGAISWLDVAWNILYFNFPSFTSLICMSVKRGLTLGTLQSKYKIIFNHYFTSYGTNSIHNIWLLYSLQNFLLWVSVRHGPGGGVEECVSLLIIILGYETTWLLRHSRDPSMISTLWRRNHFDYIKSPPIIFIIST